MQNQQQKLSPEEITESTYSEPPSHFPTPPYDPGKTQVSPPSKYGVTAIKPIHTGVSLPTHTNLSNKQAFVFDYLVRIASRQTCYSAIGEALGISRSAARDAVLALVSKKYISNLVIIRDGVFQGFAYRIDGTKCQHFIETGGTANEKYFQCSHTVTPQPHTVYSPSDHLHTHSSLSSFELSPEAKLTTQNVDLSDPEMLWWVDNGLTIKHIESWLNEFKLSPESLAQSLRSAKFDVVVNEIKPKGMPIGNPLNWIYTILKKTGMYLRPINYKSVLELRADELVDQQRRDEIANAKIRDAEIEIKFQEFMRDKESPRFQELLDSVNVFSRDDQFTLEIEMRELFRKSYALGTGTMDTS